jgi:Skp family chaperone for outer membrane proteins
VIIIIGTKRFKYIFAKKYHSMKQLYYIILVISLFSCTVKSKKEQQLEKRVKQLEMQVSESYKPGFGEMMSSIQAHHNKLWFAGKNTNWQLAAFEVKELHEIIDDIKKFQKDRSETKKMDMINPSLQKVKEAINQKHTTDFNKFFQQLTNDCNQCHQQTNFGYNKVKIPETSPFSNQEFKIH